MHRRFWLVTLFGVMATGLFREPPASKSRSEDIKLLLPASMRQAPPISARRELP
jgi:hypothetical protein